MAFAFETINLCGDLWGLCCIDELQPLNVILILQLVGIFTKRQFVFQVCYVEEKETEYAHKLEF